MERMRVGKQGCATGARYILVAETGFLGEPLQGGCEARNDHSDAKTRCDKVQHHDLQVEYIDLRRQNPKHAVSRGRFPYSCIPSTRYRSSTTDGI